MAPPSQRSTDVGQATREVRSAWRTSQLLTAAARLMERDGFHGVSMHSVADEAGVSVGLIYRYFGGKEDLLLAVIVDVLDSFAERVPDAIDGAGPDPVERVAAAFRAYCAVIDEHRHAAVLTYRESRALGPAGLERIKGLEVSTGEPLRVSLADGVAAGRLLPLDPDVFAFDLLLVAHGWALKHWHFQRTLDLDAYVRVQTAVMLGGAVAPRYRTRYRRLLASTPDTRCAAR